MSTILKSLKRLEKEKEDQYIQNQVSLPSFNSRSAVNQRVRFAWLKSKAIQWAAILLICVVGAVGLLAYNRPAGNKHKINVPSGNSPQSRAVNKNYDNKVQPNTTIAKNNTAVRKQSDPPKTQMNKTGVSPTSRSLRPKGIPKSSKEYLKSRQFPEVSLPKVKHPSVENSSKPHTDFKRPSTLTPATASNQMKSPFAVSHTKKRNGGIAAGTDERPPVKPVEEQPVSTHTQDFQPADSNSRYRNAERMTDGRLKVQAIVWAPNAQERMAVVNSQIIREGGTIEGFAVVAIGEDAVYVKEDGMRLLKVPFGQP